MMLRTTLSIVVVCLPMPPVGSVCVAAVVGSLEARSLVVATVSFVLGAMRGKSVLGTALEVEPKLFWHNAVVHGSQVSCFGCLLKYPLGHNVQDVPVAPK